MPYLGNTPSTSFATVVKDSFSGDGSETAFTLSKVATTNSVSVFVENVRQEPTTAYAVSGTTLTFTAAPPNASNNIYVLHMNPTTTTTHPAAQALTATSGTFTSDVSIDGGSFVFNESSADKDFRVESNGNANMINVDGGNDRVGIGISPSFNMQIDKSSTNTTLTDLTDAQLVLSNTGSATTNQHVKLGFRFQDGSVNGQAMIAAVRESSSARTSSLRFYSAPSSDGDPDERLSISGAGDVTVSTGNLVIGTSGKGIDFSAASGDASGASSEILDDYEEGTWTPTLLGSSSHPSITTSVAAGKFVRIGGLVFIQWNMIITNVASSGSGNAQVGGLPYAMVGNTYQGYIGIMYNDTHSNETQKGYIPNGGAYINLVPTGRTQNNLGIGTISTGYFGGGGSYTIV